MSNPFQAPDSDTFASADPVLVLDYTGRISEATPAACTFMGSTREGIVLHPLEAFVSTPRVEDLLEALISLPQDAEVLFRAELKRKDGSSIQVRLKVSSKPEHSEFTIRLVHDRRASDRFREAPDFARAILETCESPIMVLNGEDRIVFANTACESLTGLAFSELRGRPPWPYFSAAEDSERARCAVAELRESKQAPIRASWRWRTKDGDWRVVTWKLSLFLFRESGKTYILATGVDFTESERKVVEVHRAHEDVRAALERIHSVVDSVPALISYIDGDRKYLFANHRYEEWFGVPASQIEGRRVQDVLPPAVYEAKRPHLEQAFSGQTVSFELDLSDPEGGHRWMQVTYIPDQDEKGKVQGVFGLAQDVSKLRRLINEISEHQMHLKAIMENAPQAITLVDNDDRFLLVDRQFEAFLGAPRESLIGKNVRDVFPIKVAERILEENEFVRKSRLKTEFEQTLLTPEGLRTVLSVNFPLFRSDGSVYAVGTVSSDITKRKRTEVEVRWLNDRLEDRVRERTQELEKAVVALRSVVYGMAHNLRAPLRAMAGFGFILRQDYSGRVLDDFAQDLSRRIEAGAVRMDALIQGLLDFGRVASDKMELRRIPLGPFIARLLKILAREITDGAAQIDVKSDLPEVKGDEEFLRLTLVHLLSNAIKFVAPGVPAHVVISAEDSGEFIRVVVQDHGIGILPEYRERIFGLFEQLSLPEFYPGTGIGLAIAKKAVDRMGGRIDFESAPGRGSRFWVELPR